MKTLVFVLLLVCLIIGTILSVYAIIYPNNAFDVSFFSDIYAMCSACDLICIIILLIYDIKGK